MQFLSKTKPVSKLNQNYKNQRYLQRNNKINQIDQHLNSLEKSHLHRGDFQLKAIIVLS